MQEKLMRMTEGFELKSGALDLKLVKKRRDLKRITTYVYITNAAQYRVNELSELIKDYRETIAELDEEVKGMKKYIVTRKKYNVKTLQKELLEIEEQIDRQRKRNKKNLMRLAKKFPGGLTAICSSIPNYAKGGKTGITRQALYAELRRNAGALIPRHERAIAGILGVDVDEMRK